MRTRLLTLTAALAAVALAWGCGGPDEQSAAETTVSPTPSVIDTGPPAVYLSLGDSIQYGCCGDVSRSSGELFRQHLSRVLARRVEWVNLAGADTSQSFVESQLPKAEEALRGYRDQGRPVVAITFDVGGNDFVYLTDPDTHTDCALSMTPACQDLMVSALATLRARYDDILPRLNAARDPSTPLLMLTYYNPYDLGDGSPQIDATEQVLARINELIREEAEANGAVLVDIYPQFSGRACDLISGVDPTEEGHARIAAAYAGAYDALPDETRSAYRLAGAPPPEPSPTASAAEVKTPLEVAPLEFGPEADFPQDVSLIIETGCWQCDGPTTDLRRVYRDAFGDIRTDILFQSRTTITGFTLTPDGSTIAVSTCDGPCGLIAWSPRQDPVRRTTVHRSDDGGVTWSQLGTLDGHFQAVAIAGDQVLVRGPFVPESAPGGPTTPRYQLFPSGTPVTPPPGANLYAVVPLANGRTGWLSEGYEQLLDSQGNVLLTLGPGREVSGVASLPNGGMAFGWSECQGRRRYLGTAGADGTVTADYSAGGEYARVGGAISPTLLAGNVQLPPEAMPGEDVFRLGYTPALFDLAARQVRPLRNPFAQPPFPGGRNHVVAVVPGPFARVATGGDCLNVREEPAADASVLNCATDGVLLRDLGETREADGQTWVHVATPAGDEGWASAAFLER